MTKIASVCLNCKEPVCNNCMEKRKNNLYRTPERNRADCKTYYQRHKQECIERTKRNRMKKRIAEKGYEMAIYI